MRYLRRLFGKEVPLSPMAMQASTTLLENGIIRTPMDQSSLYAVTDVHVPGHPMKSARGIDDADLKHWMPEMNLLARHTYRFHDVDYAQLNKYQQEQELKWWESNDPHGATMALVFKKNI